MRVAVAVAVAGACRSVEIGPSDTGRTLMLIAICSWARTMTINGNHGACVACWSPTPESAAGSGCLGMDPSPVGLDRLEQRDDVLRGYHERDVGLLHDRGLGVVGRGRVVEIDLDQMEGLADSDDALVGDAIARPTAVARIHVDVDQVTVEQLVRRESLLPVLEGLVDLVVAPGARDDAGTVQDVAVPERKARDHHGLAIVGALRVELSHRCEIVTPGRVG